MRRRFKLFSRPVRAACPYCQTPLSRHHGWDNLARPCETCGRQIEPVREGVWLVYFTSYVEVFLIALSMWGWVSGWWNYLPAMIGAVVEIWGLVWLWPYLSRFQRAPSGKLRRCPRCS